MGLVNTFTILLLLSMQGNNLTNDKTECLRIAAWNMNGFVSSQPYAAELLKDNDIVGLSEHWLSGPELHKLDRLCVHHEVTSKSQKDLVNAPPTRGRGYGGVAIYYSKGLACAPIYGISSDRIVGIKVDIKGLKWYVLNVYMPSIDKPEDTFEDTVDVLESLIREYSKSGNIVVMGDFNAHLGASCGVRGTGHCDAKGARLRDAMYNESVQMICADTSPRGSGPMYTFSKEGMGQSWIDHIFVSATAIGNVIQCGVKAEHVLNVSDHLPVFMNINVPMNSNSYSSENVLDDMHTKRVKWHKLEKNQIDLYSCDTDKVFAQLCEQYVADDQVNLTKWCNTVIDKLVSCSSRFVDTVKRNKGKHGPKPFWSQDLSELMKAKKKCYKMWVDAGRPRDENNQMYLNHKESKRAFRKMMRMSEAKYRAGIEDKIQECQELDQREFWFLLKGKRSKKLGGVLKDSAGEVITDPNKVLGMWEDHFRKLGKPTENPAYDNKFKAHVEQKVLEFEVRNDEMEVDVFSDPISVDEVINVCRGLKNGKAQDHCGLTYEHFKYAGANVYELLAMLFNNIVMSEQYPGLLKKGLAVPLFKGGEKDPLERNDFRGITIQSVICKVFDTIVFYRSVNTIKQHVDVCKTQAACEKALSSLNSSLLLQETVAHNRDQGRDVYVSFFDTKKAFDTVWVDGLFYMLYNRGIKGKLWRLLRAAYKECLCAVLLNGRLSRWFYLLQGVKQGAIVSMLMYICFINGLMLEIMETNRGCVTLEVDAGCIGYADDLAFVTYSQANMQILIDMAVKYSNMWRFEFSNAKCACIAFCNNNRGVNLTIGNDKLNVCTEYNHVGVPIRSQGGPTTQVIQSKLDSCKRAFYSLVGCSLFKSTLSPLALSKVYLSVVVPKLLYGAEVRKYDEVEIKSYDNFNRKMGKDIQNMPSSTPNPAAITTLGWRDLCTRIDVIRLQFIQRILSLHVNSIYRLLFLRRLYYVIYAGYDKCTGPVAQIVKTCVKYNFLENVLQLVESGGIISKNAWKKNILQVVYDRDHANWRFSLTLYPKLSLFRTIVLKCEPICWWNLAKCQPYLKRTCITMVNLLCGNSILAQYRNVTLAREDRLCTMCDLGVVEDTFHFVCQCPQFSLLRESLWNNVRVGLSDEGNRQWDELDDLLKMYILLGMEYPLLTDDLLHIRIQSCIAVHKMYHQRLQLG